MRDGVKKIPTPVLIAVVVVLVFLFAKPWVQVGPGQRGVVLNFGAVQDNVLGEGLHFRIPVVQEV
ncbi:MAG TPA: SPFH domain-containing protein, partial [Smithellaceae bacterium]|nr:SPFH domain-containing protein [Smithellaceae bacterium]